MSAIDPVNPLAGLSEGELAAAKLGRTWPMLSLKEALRGVPLQQAFDFFIAAIGRAEGGCALVSKPVLGARDYAERNGAFFRELEPAGEAFTNEPSRVVGQGDQRVIAHVTRSTYVAAFNQAMVRGRSQLVELPDCVLLDFEGEEFSRIDDEIELDSAIFRRSGAEAWIITDPSTPILVDQCFSLLGPNTYAFGHWIVEYLPRLWMAMRSGLLPTVPILIDQGMARQHRQCLEMLLAPGTPIIEVAPMQRVAVGKLWFAPTYYYAPIYPQFNERFRYDLVAASPRRFRDLFQSMCAALVAPDESVPNGRKTYLARKPGSHRKLVNREAIEQLACESGFDSVYLEDLDFPEQLALIRQSGFLLGPEGSAFFMAFFARPGTKACVLNHPHTEFLTEVTALLEAVDVECVVFTGPFARIEEGGYTHFSDYEINPGDLARFLAEWTDPRC